MSKPTSDFEVSINGQTFLTVMQGQLNVRGLDLQSDLGSISRLICILSDVLGSAITAQTHTAPLPPIRDNCPQVGRNGNVYTLQRGAQS